MDERINRIAALANVATYNEQATREYVDGAPHIKHASLRKFYGAMVVQVFDRAAMHAAPPRVLDLGAGEGSVTLPFLELGAHVTAVDISISQLDALREKCAAHGSMLDIRCADIDDVLKERTAQYDIVVVNSFLHHVPDYLGMITAATQVLRPHGQFFSFQDPLRYDSLGKATRMFSTAAYLSWRVFKGDVLGGIRRRLRRSKGVYLEDSPQDNTEYHVTRNGVDQDGIQTLLETQGFDPTVVRYFATQSRIFQEIGRLAGFQNMFAVVAQRRA